MFDVIIFVWRFGHIMCEHKSASINEKKMLHQSTYIHPVYANFLTISLASRLTGIRSTVLVIINKILKFKNYKTSKVSVPCRGHF